MPDDDRPSQSRLGGASATTPPTSEAAGIGLGAGQAPASVPPSPQLDATLGEFLSPESSLRRAVHQLGLDEAVRLLAKEYSKQAIKNSLAKARVVYVKFCKLLAVMRLEVRIMRPRGARVSSAP
jgi:hypothetical protein